MVAEQFEYLFSPLQIRSMTVKNRIVSTPHGTGLAGPDFLPSEDQVYYYAERAKGGIGMIVMGASFTHPSSPLIAGSNRSYDERSIPGFKKIAEAVHAHGVKMIGQIDHAGSYASSELTEHPLWAPSPLSHLIVPELPHEMDIDEIKSVIEGAAQAAYNFKAGGFDGVEIMFAGPFLFPSFISTITNKRTDIYGGSPEKRLRFAYEVIDRVREVVGDDLVVGVRVLGDEFTDGGLTLQDMVGIAPKLEATGKIDYIHVRAGFITSKQFGAPDLHVPTGAFVYLAAAIKEALKEIPVCTVTRINDPLLAEKILVDGHADLIGMTRATIADPEMPIKAREGRLDDIRTCIACNQGCIERVVWSLPIRCVQNAAVGKEKEWGIGTLRPASARKKVVIIGGGPAGMEAARIAALRGHEVILYEKGPELGGQVAIAMKAPKREEFGGIIRFLEGQLKKLGVKIRLGQEATLEIVKTEAPDAVVVATGALPPPFGLSGDNKNVFGVEDVLLGEAVIGQNVLVAEDGEGTWKCCATAEFLADQGKKVVVVTPNTFVGMRIEPISLEGMYKRWGPLGIRSCPNRMVKGFTGNTVITVDVYSKEEIRIEGIDTVVWTTGYLANDGLYRALKGQVKELYGIGDCIAPRRARDAIREGHSVGRML